MILTYPLTIFFSTLPLITARQITIINSCRQTVWPGIFSEPGPLPNHATGWEMKPGEQEIVEVSDQWRSGRIHARTGCSMQGGNFECLSGACGGGAEGAGVRGSIECKTTCQPATLAEFTLGDGGMDHYDVSLVDGYNIGMSIVPSKKNCAAPHCSKNINEKCPDVLRFGIDQSGVNLGCMSSCKGGFGQEKYGNRACCTDGYNVSDACPMEGVDFYNLFKDNCPGAYAYAYETSLKTCTTTDGVMADYTIELCPESGSFLGSNPPSTEYANDLSKVSNTVTMWNVTHSVVPSPTAGVAKNKFKITVQDGPKPSISGVDRSDHLDQNVHGRPGVQAGHAQGAPSGATAAVGDPLHSPVSKPQGSNGVPGASGAADRGTDGGMGWKPQQIAVVHDSPPIAAPTTSTNVAPTTSATAIQAGATSVSPVAVQVDHQGDVVEGIIKVSNPQVDVPLTGNFLVDPAIAPKRKGRCPAKHDGQAKRSKPVDAETEMKTASLEPNEGSRSPEKNNEAKSRRWRA